MGREGGGADLNLGAAAPPMAEFVGLAAAAKSSAPVRRSVKDGGRREKEKSEAPDVVPMLSGADPMNPPRRLAGEGKRGERERDRAK